MPKHSVSLCHFWDVRHMDSKWTHRLIVTFSFFRTTICCSTELADKKLLMANGHLLNPLYCLPKTEIHQYVIQSWENISGFNSNFNFMFSQYSSLLAFFGLTKIENTYFVAEYHSLTKSRICKRRGILSVILWLFSLNLFFSNQIIHCYCSTNQKKVQVS